ncbi:MAG: hypothetical protein ABIJ33_01705 [Patescibacteria group bacterium]|nr:hypothetical protein [Patescibacteria group bacterium]
MKKIQVTPTSRLKLRKNGCVRKNNQPESSFSNGNAVENLLKISKSAGKGPKDLSINDNLLYE